MAASDYNGKEKASLNNIKEMVANATSLEELRGNMGLGRELSTLQAANGGTGVTDLNQVATTIANAITTAIGNMKLNELNTKSAAFVAGSGWSGTSDFVYPSCSIRYSVGSDLAVSEQGIKIRTDGLYRVFAFAMPNSGGTGESGRFAIYENSSKTDIPIISGVARLGSSSSQGAYAFTYGSSNSYFDAFFKANADLRPKFINPASDFAFRVSIIKFN